LPVEEGSGEKEEGTSPGSRPKGKLLGEKKTTQRRRRKKRGERELLGKLRGRWDGD
jgi:hypothetical protein